MPNTLQVMYPIGDDTSFDYAYYLSTHMQLVGEHMGPHIDRTLVTKGIAGGPDVPPGFYAVASIVFKSDDDMGAAMKASGPVLADIPNFTNTKPLTLIGEAVG